MMLANRILLWGLEALLLFLPLIAIYLVIHFTDQRITIKRLIGYGDLLLMIAVYSTSTLLHVLGNPAIGDGERTFSMLVLILLMGLGMMSYGVLTAARISSNEVYLYLGNKTVTRLLFFCLAMSLGINFYCTVCVSAQP
ncbi:hypothetical protein [Megalodesulfovibrio gigas]|uniref:Uncharacterized protein n=1 Tax=Megalodesulfovibrio gigas (strain ATCC 19364 / DSM 1382 / NCIMB 9332 / VKM B-1759) TaxID=1121448 RepID=T2G9D1_MEGG1|nr:hypothetical protein [Megalodesulfovibrio gigas]AGW12784.1 hypothetical protein DGI_0893 [Megalodesulfovibrio gigas DSM 1382 = ATCC 19364]